MLMIPLHILLDDKPSNIPAVLNEKWLGVNRKTIKNMISGKHKTSKRTSKIICSNISKFTDDIPGFEVNFNLISDILTDHNIIRNLSITDIVKDRFFKYSLSIDNEISKLNLRFISDVEKIKKEQEDKQIQKLFLLLTDYPFPNGMFKLDLDFDKIKVSDAIKILNRIRVDLVFHLLSAYDVEYNHRFLKKINGNKSLFATYLPRFKNNDLLIPIAIWFDLLMDKYGYKSINSFATSIPQLTINPKYGNDQSKIRMMRKWRSGSIYPTWENIDCIIESIANDHYDNSELEYLKEQGRVVYSYIKIFQKLLDLMQRNGKEEFGFNLNDTIEYFGRYHYWYNYHSAKFGAKQSEPADN